MSEPKKIAALYSHGPHFPRLLHHLRAAHPGAAIVALAPADYPAERLAGAADATIPLEGPPEAQRGWRALQQVRRILRQTNCDMIAVMFDSPRLRLLCALSGVPLRYCLTPDGRYFRVRLGIAPALAAMLYRPLIGNLRCLRIRRIVYRQPVGK